LPTLDIHRNKKISLVKQSKLLNQTKDTNPLPTIPETSLITKQNNHNNCFIEAHDKILDEQQTANDTIIQRQQERITIVNQVNKMIVIDTVVEDNKNKNIKIATENEIMNIISSEKVPLKSERKIERSTKTNQSVPTTRRSVQGIQIIETDKSIEKTDPVPYRHT
jgi:hypothetical protein